jgi:hypothetical protein
VNVKVYFQHARYLKRAAEPVVRRPARGLSQSAFRQEGP